MLGANWLYDLKCIWDFANRQISIDGCAAVPVSPNTHPSLQACGSPRCPVWVIGGADDDQGGSPADVLGGHPLTAPATTGVTQPLLDKLPDDLTNEKRTQVGDLLHEYDDIFSKGPMMCGAPL